MARNFTFLILSQQFPFSQRIHSWSYNDLNIDADIAMYLQKAEQQVNGDVIDKIFAFASDSVQKIRS